MHEIRILIVVFFVGACVACGQEPVSSDSDAAASSTASAPAFVSVADASAELEAMYETDQGHRRAIIELEKNHGRNSSEVREAWSKQTVIDAQNIARLEVIIAQHGWPGRTQFGPKAARAAFLVLQHAELSQQKKYLPLLREAAAQRELPASSLALLEDRVRTREGQSQIYGSQVRRNAGDEWEPLPIEDEVNVDARRASVGLGPLSEYLQGFADRSGGSVNPKWAKPAEKPADEPVDSTAENAAITLERSRIKRP